MCIYTVVTDCVVDLRFYVCFKFDNSFSLVPQPVVTNQLGTVNNVIQVKKTDFEVFDALMVDSQKCSDMSG